MPEAGTSAEATRAELEAVIAAAQLSEPPSSCPKCHASRLWLAVGFREIDCRCCGWTGYLRWERPQEPDWKKMSAHEVARLGAKERLISMSPEAVEKHMQMMRSARSTRRRRS